MRDAAILLAAAGLFLFVLAPHLARTAWVVQ
jgi:hypothetical protein